MEQIGPLKPHAHIPEWMESGPICIGYFPDVSLPFVFESIQNDGNQYEIEVAVRNFLSLTIDDRSLATPHVYKNYVNFAEAVGLEYIDIEINEPGDVWSHVQPTAVRVIRRPWGDAKVYVVITAECDWEIEHGLQIVYRDGSELSRVSARDGHLTWADALDLPDEEDWVS